VRELRSESVPVWLLLLTAVACRGPEGTASAKGAPSAGASVVAQAPGSVVPAVASAAPEPKVASPKSPEPQPDSAPRLYAKSRFVWVWPEPNAEKQWIGFLWTGSSVRLKNTTPRPGPGCKSFYEIEPYGFVCVDERKATLDPNDPVYRALAPFSPKVDEPEPHRYGESIGLPRYFAAPTPELQRQRERDLTSHLRDVEQARAGQVPKRLSGVDLSLTGGEPPALPELASGFFEDRRQLLPRSTVAFSTEARFGDRTFLLGADYAWVPKDRVIPYPHVSFHGLKLDQDATLPLAYFRGKDRPKYARSGDTFTPTGQSFARLSWVGLTGTSVRQDEERYLETREAGVWIKESEAVVPRPKHKTPWGAEVGAPDTTGRARGRGSWIEVAIDGGWMIAYEGTRPVYVTLMSPGRGGAAVDGENPLDRSATPTGTYSITGKLKTATMEAPGEYIHSDVPFAQNITGPYAFHAAYWHDNWGKPQSGGCINLSPIDAKWLFEFTEPKVPQGWHAMRLLTSKHSPTVVVLHR
jgi:hypothetical protein